MKYLATHTRTWFESALVEYFAVTFLQLASQANDQPCFVLFQVLPSLIGIAWPGNQWDSTGLSLVCPQLGPTVTSNQVWFR